MIKQGEKHIKSFSDYKDDYQIPDSMHLPMRKSWAWLMMKVLAENLSML
jgi:hypothetical protein